MTDADPMRTVLRPGGAALAALPDLFVVIDRFEPKMQRAQNRAEADRWYSGKQKMHTSKSQVTVDGQTGELCDISASVRGPTADTILLKEAGVLERVPEGVGKEGDLADVGIGELAGGRWGATPRRKPRAQEHAAADKAYNTAFSQRWIIVEHSIGQMRRYQAITAPDREHRRGPAARVRAVAGLVNRQLRNRYRELAA